MAKKKKAAARKVRVKRKRENATLEGKSLLVSLPGGPQVVVTDVESNEEAWEKYKEVAGVVESDHKPRFQIPGDDLIVNEKGVVVDEVGAIVLGSTGGHDWDDEIEPDDEPVE